MKAFLLICGIVLGLVGAFLLVRPDKPFGITLASFSLVVIGVTCIVMGIL